MADKVAELFNQFEQLSDEAYYPASGRLVITSRHFVAEIGEHGGAFKYRNTGEAVSGIPQAAKATMFNELIAALKNGEYEIC